MTYRRIAVVFSGVFVIAAACGSSPRAGLDAPETSTTTTSSTTGVAVSVTSSTTSSTASSTPLPLSGTGVRGRVTASPTCPVERPDQPCPPRPVRGRVDALGASGEVTASVQTASDGRYAIALAPGNYTLRVDTGSSFPRCPNVSVTVTPGAPANADIDCDTGIR